MNYITQAAWMHRSYGYAPTYGYHHSLGGGGSWVGHMIVSSVIHGLIYSVIFRGLRYMSLSEVILLLVVVIGGIYLWNRNQGCRRW
ncbi:hypothetical protein HN018_26725 (plasmid) [Lichenicola cladoniae]|uniref:Uncharacterized protein n=1 Tax=Lichenicola cladoniae TaxID=1484109 RepID=A0A6M8HZF9_9PROT|nr:hypothetical protein [Lichenicola cladoniae]NPD66616.1 hypothetical protein [Acetobacteraceae bacterium]QKE93728.1 hypothetical protein HN018_26725 [Lichenicola cladoniae]